MTDEDNLCYFLHNHKSRENFRQEFGRTSSLKIKDTKKFLIINNEQTNVCLWFSFLSDKTHFVKNLVDFCTQNKIK